MSFCRSFYIFILFCSLLHKQVNSLMILLNCVINYMINKRAQTVQGYLTPTKLLTSIIKQNKDKSLSKINKSTYSANRNGGQNQDSTFIIDTSNSARQYEKNSFAASSNFSKPYLQNSLKKKELKFSQQREILPKQIKQTQNQILKQSQQSIKSQKSGKKQNISHFNFNADFQKRNNLSTIVNDNKYFNLSRNNTDNTYVRQNNTYVRQLSDSRAPPKNPEIMTLQCYDLIRKLTKVKEGLQLEISQLQRLLDNTSKYLQNIDVQYQKIKENILNYTSLCLDNAFKQYKQNMVQWGKYQDFQRKGLQMLRQISEYIENQQQTLNKKLTYTQTTAHSLDLQKRITHYSEFIQEIKNVREQCVSMRPTISQEKIQAYQRGLAVLCNF